MDRLTRALIAAAIAIGASGCNAVGPATCARDEASNPFVSFTEGTAADGVYMSSDWNGEYLYFPGGMHYRIVHHLGV